MNGGDLAILSVNDLDVLKESSDPRTSRNYWIGLRNTIWQWKWQKTGLMSGLGYLVRLMKRTH